MKLFKFDSNVFCCFKDCFFKVIATDVMANRLPLLFNRDGEPRFLFYWQSNATRFKSFDKDLLTLVEKVDKAILEQLPPRRMHRTFCLFIRQTILSLPWTVKYFSLSSFVSNVDLN